MSKYLDVWVKPWVPTSCPHCWAPYGWEKVLEELHYLRSGRSFLERLLNVQYPRPTKEED